MSREGRSGRRRPSTDGVVPAMIATSPWRWPRTPRAEHRVGRPSTTAVRRGRPTVRQLSRNGAQSLPDNPRLVPELRCRDQSSFRARWTLRTRRSTQPCGSVRQLAGGWRRARSWRGHRGQGRPRRRSRACSGQIAGRHPLPGERETSSAQRRLRKIGPRLPPCRPPSDRRGDRATLRSSSRRGSATFAVNPSPAHDAGGTSWASFERRQRRPQWWARSARWGWAGSRDSCGPQTPPRSGRRPRDHFHADVPQVDARKVGAWIVTTSAMAFGCGHHGQPRRRRRERLVDARSSCTAIRNRFSNCSGWEQAHRVSPSLVPPGGNASSAWATA